jgi:hypothetical protein
LANGTSEARIVLVDDNGVRATMTASWLRQMGWGEVAALTAGPTDADWVSGPHQPRVLGLERLTVPTIEPAALRERLAAGSALVVDLDTQPPLCPGPYPGRLVRDPLAARRGLGEAPDGRDHRADLAGWRHGAACRGRDRRCRERAG